MWGHVGRVVSLALLVALAGCGATPPPEDPTATVDVRTANDADETHVVTVSVVPDGFEEVVVEDADGTVETVAATSIDAVPPAAFEGAVSVRVVGEGVRTVRYDLPPGTGQGRTFEVATGNVTVVYSVATSGRADGEALRSVGVAACGTGAGRTTLDLRIRPGGSLDAATICA